MSKNNDQMLYKRISTAKKRSNEAVFFHTEEGTLIYINKIPRPSIINTNIERYILPIKNTTLGREYCILCISYYTALSSFSPFLSVNFCFSAGIISSSRLSLCIFTFLFFSIFAFPTWLTKTCFISPNSSF